MKKETVARRMVTVGFCFSPADFTPVPTACTALLCYTGRGTPSNYMVFILRVLKTQGLGKAD